METVSNSENRIKLLLVPAGSFLLILLAVLSTIGSVLSSLLADFDVREMLPVWLIAAFIIVTLVTLWRGKGFVICLMLALIFILYKIPAILNGAKWTLFSITNEINKYFDIKVLLQGVSAASEDVRLFITIIGIMLMLPLSLAICLRRSCIYTLIITLPFTLPILALNDNPPNPVFLVGLISTYLILILSSVLSPNDFRKRGLAVFPAAALAAVLICVTYVITPAENPDRGEFIHTIDSQIRRIAWGRDSAGQTGTGWPDNIEDGWKFNTSSVAVAGAGPRTVTNQEILELTTTVAGTFYIRGYAMQDFDGRTWSNTVNTWQFPELMSLEKPALIAKAYAELNRGDAPEYAVMSIKKTGDQSDIYYYPYYSLYADDTLTFSSFTKTTGDPPYAPQGRTAVIGVREGAENGPGGSRTDMVGFYYTEIFIPDAAEALHRAGAGGEQLQPAGSAASGSAATGSGATGSGAQPGDSTQILTNLSEYNEKVRELYLQIDESTAEKLRQLAAQADIYPEGDRAEIAAQVAKYVASAARYTFSPPITPEGEDFAVYFLQMSRRGYCIHFATAATLMLRALDVPARFTCGFIQYVSERDVGAPIRVTDRAAHAWVEVYYDDVGWIPLEVSPASSQTAVPGQSSGAASGGAYAPDATPAQGDPYEGIITSPPQPSSGAAAGSGPEAAVTPVKEIRVLPILFICAAAFVLLLILRRAFAYSRRKRLFGQLNTNKAVLYIWRHIIRLRRIAQPLMLPQAASQPASALHTMAPTPEEIEELALKARFSNHILSEQERLTAVRYANDLSRMIDVQSSALKRLYVKYGLGLN